MGDSHAHGNRAQRRAAGQRGGDIAAIVNAPRPHHSWPHRGKPGTAGNQKRRRKAAERDMFWRKWAADRHSELCEELDNEQELRQMEAELGAAIHLR